MTTPNDAPGRWSRLPVSLRAILAGFLIVLIPVNVWPLLLLNLGVRLATIVEAGFLGLFLWWTAGGGPPRKMQVARALAFRQRRLSRKQWFWGILGALSFAVAVHSSIVLLFRFVRFPTAAFHRGYDLSFVPTLSLRWMAVVVSAISAGICEETGFRGYMQRPVEQRHGAGIAILISSFCFTVLHLTKAWAQIGMIPIVFGAGVLLGLLAWSSGSLLPGMIGHVIMDIGLFAYWWTGIAGKFTARPITETGLDQSFLIACAVFATALLAVFLAISRLRRIGASLS